MAVTVDPETPIGLVRTLITDLDPDSPLFTDGQLQALLVTCDNRPKLAAAMALDTIATSEALISKRIKTLDLSTDGPAVAGALREHATRLREQDDDDDAFDIVYFPPGRV